MVERSPETFASEPCREKSFEAVVLQTCSFYASQCYRHVVMLLRRGGIYRCAVSGGIAAEYC